MFEKSDFLSVKSFQTVCFDAQNLENVIFLVQILTLVLLHCIS